LHPRKLLNITGGSVGLIAGGIDGLIAGGSDGLIATLQKAVRDL
jgi:hypothetical protein